MDAPLRGPRLLVLALAGLALVGCHRAAERESGGAATLATAPLHDGAVKHPDPAGIHNLYEVAPGLWSGSIPEGDAGFDSLAAMGVRTVIAVDATSPQLDRIRACGMRSIHLPITYAGIEPDTQLALVRAVRDSEGPIYIHCHHGKHRGPAAAATAAVALGLVTEPQGQAFLHAAGTSPNYKGLFECVAEADDISEGDIETWDGRLVELQDVGGIAGAMAAIDNHFAFLDRLAENEWAAHREHPDRTAISEAGALHDLFRRTAELGDMEHEPWAKEMNEAVKIALALESALVAADTSAAHDAITRLGDSCNDCHKAHRGVRPW